MLWQHPRTNAAAEAHGGGGTAGERSSSTAPGRPPTRRRLTEPLVSLLHEREELRRVYAPADVIDSAVRDGV